MITLLDNHLEILKQELHQKIARNPLYSISAFAKQIGISQSYLSLLLSGKRELKPALLQKISSYMPWSDIEKKYFELLTSEKQAKNASVKEFYQQKISSFKILEQKNILSLELFDTIYDWRYSALLELIYQSQKNINLPNQTPEIWANRLNVKKKFISTALKKLKNLKLIDQCQEGKWYRIDNGLLNTPTDLAHQALKKFHLQIFELASSAIQNQSVERRCFQGHTMAINNQKIPEAKQLIQQFIQQMSLLLEDEQVNEVYQLQINFFSLENLTIKGKK